MGDVAEDGTLDPFAGQAIFLIPLVPGLDLQGDEAAPEAEATEAEAAAEEPDFPAAQRRNLRAAEFKLLDAPIEAGCDCPACRNFSVAYLHHLYRENHVPGQIFFQY